MGLQEKNRAGRGDAHWWPYPAIRGFPSNRPTSPLVSPRQAQRSKGDGHQFLHHCSLQNRGNRLFAKPWVSVGGNEGHLPWKYSTTGPKTRGWDGGLGSRRQSGEKRCPRAIYIQSNSLAWIVSDMGHSYQDLPRCTSTMHIPQPCPSLNTLESTASNY